MTNLESLVNQSLGGDDDSFAELVRRFQDMAVGYAFSVLKNRDLAEDVAQEAFLESYLQLHQLREPAAFPGWFRRIVFKHCDRHIRKERVITVPLENEVEEPTSTDDEFSSTETKEQVWAAINSLAEHERTPLVLFYMTGHSQQEIASYLNVPVTTIKKRLFSARQRLRDNLMDLAIDSLRETRPSRDSRFAENLLELLKAAREGKLEEVRSVLVKNKQLLNARDWLGNSALIIAANSGHDAIVELLYRAGVEPDIHEAAAIGNTDRVAQLVDTNPDSINSFSKEGFSPLTLAAHFGHAETSQWLLDHDADIDLVSTHRLGVTPLHAALFGKSIATARVLIENGANVNIARGGATWPRSGWTALHYAAGFGLKELVLLMLSHGADVTILDEQLKTPLDIAREEEQHEIVELLMERKKE